MKFQTPHLPQKVKSIITPVIITNIDDMSCAEIQSEGEVIGGQDKVLFVEKIS